MVSDISYEYHYSQYQGGKITSIHTHVLTAMITTIFYLHGLENFIQVSSSKRLFPASSCSDTILLFFKF